MGLPPQDKTDDAITFQDLDAVWPWGWLLTPAAHAELTKLTTKLADKVKYTTPSTSSTAIVASTAASSPSSAAARKPLATKATLTAEVMSLFA